MRNATTVLESEQAKDRVATLRDRAQLGANKNLLFWYRELYRYQFRDFSKPKALSILEIGAARALKQFLPNVVTSDVLVTASRVFGKNYPGQRDCYSLFLSNTKRPRRSISA